MLRQRPTLFEASPRRTEAPTNDVTSLLSAVSFPGIKGAVFDSAIAIIGRHGQPAGPLSVNDLTPCFGARKLRFVHAVAECQRSAKKKDAVHISDTVYELHRFSFADEGPFMLGNAYDPVSVGIVSVISNQSAEGKRVVVRIPSCLAYSATNDKPNPACVSPDAQRPCARTAQID